MRRQSIRIASIRKFFLEHKEETVGRAFDPTSCPVARYLRSKHPNHFVKVTPYAVTVISDSTNEYVHYTVPKWLRAFIQEVDVPYRPREMNGNIAEYYLHLAVRKTKERTNK